MLEQGSPHSVLEGRCPAEFSSNLPQHTCLEVSSIPRKSLISCFRCVWLGLELNSAGHRPSRNKCGDPCARAIKASGFSPTYPLGSQPSKDKRSFRYIAIERASSGDAVHSRIFFAQYMRRNPCIFPSNTSWRYNTPGDFVSMHLLGPFTGFAITAVVLT